MFNSFSYERDIENGALTMTDSFVFYLMTVVITLVMLNLTIAEINETYTRVTEASEKIDNVQLNSIIIELEQYLNPFNANLGHPQFMVFVEYND
jgi:hypothetical protein